MSDPGELRWEAPGPGQWYLTVDHFPRPVSRLFSTLFPPTTGGWTTACRHYGMPAREPRWAAVNNWLYYSPAGGGVDDETERAAAETIRTERWRDDIAAWYDLDRPRIIGLNRSLQATAVATMRDDQLAGHLGRAMDHFLDVGRRHFELHITSSLAGGLAMQQLERWGIGPAEIAPHLAGASPASAAARRHVDRIANAVGGRVPESIDDIRGASPEAAQALHDYLDEYGWRCLDQHELRGAALVERPDILLATVRARLAGVGTAPSPIDRTELRRRVPDADQERFDEALEQLRAAYGINDDNVGITWGWPLGIVRRALLEAGRRLATRGAIADPTHVFEGEPDEVLALLRGAGPPADVLAARAATYDAAIGLDPPAVLGEPLGGSAPAELPPPVARLVEAERALWAAPPVSPGEPLSGIGIGTAAYVGRACVVDGDGYLDLQPGDVIVATVTHAGHNTVFPIAGAVATEHGGLLSHPAVLARELGLPAVVGAGGLMAHVQTGQTVEVDPVAGVVRVLD